ncbi:MAG: glutamate formimidoyltransferase [Acidobacteria bacterium]|nr:glutamate formimidoyltransferase [Acidobacteriota bacterium]
MKKIVECIPNFSEGRRREVVDALAEALTSAPGVALLDSEMDAAHNRCVITVAGAPEALADCVVRAVGKAAELIDLRNHRGEHPRIGAADVIPLVPISGTTMDECIALSERIGAEIASRYGIPVYLYEQSARVPSRQDLAYIRKGEFETLREEIATVPERKPDFGPLAVHPSAGATVVGARFPLIAYNVYLHTSDLKVAQAVARAVRNSSGGLRYVKALGFEIKERGQVQVSMNLTNFEATPIFRVFEMVKREAERYGVAVASSEIVGLVPQKALDDCADYYLRLEGFSTRQVLENRLAEALPPSSGVEEFVSAVAAPTPTPGGGSVAALAGWLASALGEMVAGLTEAREKFAAEHREAAALRRKLAAAGRDLRQLVAEDAAAYQAVVSAFGLPKETEDQKARRSAAIQEATRVATETPLRTARTAASVLETLETLMAIGNPNARSDAAVGAQLAYAAVKGAQYNVLVNLPGLKDAAFVQNCRNEVSDLARRCQQILNRIDEGIR